MAVVQGLAEIPEGSRVHLYSDSQYVLNCAFGDWEKKKNTDLWKRFDNIAGKYDIDATWVRGHNGNRLNERCDDLCTRAMRNPTKVDNGYVLMPHDSTSAGSKKTGAMGVEIEIPAEYSPREIVRVRAAEYANLRHVKLPCAKRLLNFLCKKKHSFSDYQNLRTDGIDFWSRKNKEACLQDDPQAGAIAEAVEKNLENEKDRATAFRWYARGLDLPDAIRKVLVDREISENAMHSKKNII